MHVYKNIAVHVYVLYDIYTLPRLRDFFCIYDLPMLTYTKCTYTCNFTRMWALLFLYMYNFIKSYTKYLQVYIRGLCHLYEVLLYVKKVARIRNRSFRIRFQVFVYVKKCASTKWCLYEVKSLTDAYCALPAGQVGDDYNCNLLVCLRACSYVRNLLPYFPWLALLHALDNAFFPAAFTDGLL